MRRTIVFSLAVLMLCGVSSWAQDGRRANSILLSGPWEFALGNGSEQPFEQSMQSDLDWQDVTLPGQFLPWSERATTSIEFIWTRRTFSVSEAQTSQLAVLRWNRIVHGATAWINGQKVGYNEPTGPYQVVLPPGVLRAGRNQILLKIAGGAGVRKSKSGHFLFPAGQIWGPSKPNMPSVAQDVWIDFASRAYMKWILAIPDLQRKTVKIRVTTTGLRRLENLTVVAEVSPWPRGEVVGRGSTSARVTPDKDPLGGEHFVVDVPIHNCQPWTPEDRYLYAANVSLRDGGQILDLAKIRFGMRDIQVVDGNYHLNGKTLWIRGSNLVHEWDWADVITGKEHAYLVTEAREMNMNAFRTHTQPPPKLWADICDEHGTMILAEFPVLYNYRNHKYAAEEWGIFHRNCMTDTAGWMARLWNHPSVIMWVLSNESRNDNEWEAGPFRDFVTGLDPTRPTMRTGTTGTKTNYDVHTCGNTNHWTHEGRMQMVIDDWFRQAGDRTVTNSEYMNIFARPKGQWTGNDDEHADRLAYAQLGAEHTEAMRRARVDAMLPYMYAGWTRTRRGSVWKAGFAQPVSACWHSALSPVLASLDLFDANYVTGQEVTTDLCLINDSWHDAEIHVELLLTRECPEFIPEANCLEKPLASWGFDFRLRADSLHKKPITWSLPAEAGNYWLTARTTGIPGRPVLSQRFVRAVVPPAVPPAANRRTVVVLGGDPASHDFFRDQGLTISGLPDHLDPNKHVVLMWNPGRLTDQTDRLATLLKNFAAEGGRTVVLAADKWDWRALCHAQVGRMGGSRAFLYPGVEHNLLRGVDPECLKRFNGVPGTVATRDITGPAVENSERILWVREPKHTVVAEVPTADGKGTILFVQLDLRQRVRRSGRHYDPVAERILLNAVSP